MSCGNLSARTKANKPAPAADAPIARLLAIVGQGRRAPEQERSVTMRALRAKPDALKGQNSLAQGKRSAALGCGPKTISSLFPFPVWRASSAPDRKRKKGRLVGVSFTQGGGHPPSPSSGGAGGGLALGWYDGAPSGASDRPTDCASRRRKFVSPRFEHR